MSALSDELDAWVAAHWDPELRLRDWWRVLAESGWAFPAWPRGLGGRECSTAEAREIGRGLASLGTMGSPSGVGQTMGGPTVLAHGTPEQRRVLVAPLADGREGWCQLFSEPGAGSDLASLQTRAVRDGDEWVVNGQKVWNSGAHLADRGLLLARTDVGVPKHEGISYFVIDMDQVGVEARPLRQMNGEAEFCEVFLRDARVPADRMIGRPGEGWAIARTTLAFERSGVATMGSGPPGALPGTRAGMLDRAVGELVDEARRRARRRTIGGFVIDNRTFGELAEERGLHEDPLARQQLASFRTLTRLNRYRGLRTRAKAAIGQAPGAEASVGKLAMSDIARASRDLAFSLMGAHGMLDRDDAPRQGAVHRVALASFGASMGGGTDEIQRNLIGERELGLPKEPPAEGGTTT